MKNKRVGIIVGLSLLLAAVGCSGAAEGDGQNDGDESATRTGFGTNDGASSGAVPTLSASSSGGAGDVGNVTPGSACATSSASVEAPPVHLVFMIDRSGSMGNSKHGQNEKVRWKPVVSGLKAFFADPANANVHASIAFFGQGGGDAVQCSAATYATPAVSMRGLPEADAFADALDDASPGGGTPTKPALKGAIQYAQQIKASLPAGEKVAIVLATDGDPNDCSSTAENVAAEAAAVAASIPTYVIGVGPEATKLDTIANGGGTGDAIMIPTSDPAQVSADLRAAVGQIKAEQLGCSYALPAPPSGQTLDVNAVNVDYTPAGGSSQTLPYSADCSNPNGWHYDDAAAPKEVVMCAASCATLKADVTGGKLDIVFGCAISAPPGTELPGGGVR
ncbi:MAG: VWA domain-containing protein [Labilithrix sp.]|nr:VWA domain-containing protein [Labilithrix sp.]MCW5811013.1 VWA domain-containing protein [Labilithrix sp.]